MRQGARTRLAQLLDETREPRQQRLVRPSPMAPHTRLQAAVLNQDDRNCLKKSGKLLRGGKPVPEVPISTLQGRTVTLDKSGRWRIAQRLQHALDRHEHRLHVAVRQRRRNQADHFAIAHVLVSIQQLQGVGRDKPAVMPRAVEPLQPGSLVAAPIRGG